jgi:hypothetical protein
MRGEGTRENPSLETLHLEVGGAICPVPDEDRRPELGANFFEFRRGPSL